VNQGKKHIPKAHNTTHDEQAYSTKLGEEQETSPVLKKSKESQKGTNMEQQSVVNPSHKGMKCRVKAQGE
jgi:hypothetical protein